MEPILCLRTVLNVKRTRQVAFQYIFQQYFYMRDIVLVGKMFALANQVIKSSHADPGNARL